MLINDTILVYYKNYIIFISIHKKSQLVTKLYSMLINMISTDNFNIIKGLIITFKFIKKHCRLCFLH